MKIRKKESLDEPRSSLYGDSKPGAGSWAITDPAKYKAIAQQAKMDSTRPPEIWVNDGQGRRLRFLDTEPIVSFRVYRFKQNNRWVRVVAPREGKPDLLSTRLNLRPSHVFLYRVIDIEGYTDRRGKKHTFLPRFYVATARQYEQLRMLASEVEMPFTKFDIKVTRAGTGTNTTYSFIQKAPTPMTPEMKKAAASFPKDSWSEFYRPITTAQQQLIVASAGAAEEEEEEESSPY